MRMNRLAVHLGERGVNDAISKIAVQNTQAHMGGIGVYREQLLPLPERIGGRELPAGEEGFPEAANRGGWVWRLKSRQFGCGRQRQDCNQGDGLGPRRRGSRVVGFRSTSGTRQAALPACFDIADFDCAGVSPECLLGQASDFPLRAFLRPLPASDGASLVCLCRQPLLVATHRLAFPTSRHRSIIFFPYLERGRNWNGR